MIQFWSFGGSVYSFIAITLRYPRQSRHYNQKYSARFSANLKVFA